MPNPVERARHYLSRAKECLQLAELVETDELRDHYRVLAPRLPSPRLFWPMAPS
jgi:hypothetical protein